MSCPNVNAKSWKNLVDRIGTFEAMKEFIKNNEEIPDASQYPESFKGINATLKIVTALQKTPRTNYPSNQIQGFYNDLIKFGAPKNQIDLLKQHIADNNITDINVNDLIVSLLSEISYTVEINTATDKKVYGHEDSPEYDSKGEIIPHNKEFNTQHYSNLTVQGGTNYTENEISTPGIIPSIKGHAQFATDNGIGWFRSDDKLTGKVSGGEYKQSLDQFGQPSGMGVEFTDYDYYQSLDLEGKLIGKELENFNKLKEQDLKNSKPTKTRRILEVQSDLYQKGRDIKDPNDIIKDLEKQGKLKIVCD